jgi:hypothetical protein
MLSAFFISISGVPTNGSLVMSGRARPSSRAGVVAHVRSSQHRAWTYAAFNCSRLTLFFFL